MSEPLKTARTLPPHPNLEQLKKQAKDLLAAYAARERAAVAEVEAHHLHHPKSGELGAESFALHDAQLMLARSYGFVRDDVLMSTPLGWACRWGRENLVTLLLERGAPANEPDIEPWATPLAWARKMGHTAIEIRLRERGAVA